MNQVTETPQANVTDPSSQRPAQQDYVLLDYSGSMSGKRQDSLAAIDNYVAQLRGDGINTAVTVAAFTTQSYGNALQYSILRNATPEAWTDLTYDNEISMTMGSTPLYDAINMMGRELRQTLPLKCSVLIITDGDENASQTTAEQALGILNWMRGMGWQITFLGCDFENSRQAKLLGANDSNAVGVSVKRLVDATSLLAEKRANYSRYGTDMNLTSDEKNEIGGLLPDHTAK